MTSPSLHASKHQAKTTSSILLDRHHHSSGAAHRDSWSLWGCSSLLMKIGNQGMEFEHSGLNDSFQDTQQWHGGAENQACGPTRFRAERSTGILFTAVSIAPRSTKESPGPGSSSPCTTKVAREYNTVLQPAAGCCVFSRPCAVTWSKPGGGSFAFWDLLLVLPCSPLQEDYKDEHTPLLVFPDVPLYLLIFLEKKIRFDNVILF